MGAESRIKGIVSNEDSFESGVANVSRDEAAPVSGLIDVAQQRYMYEQERKILSKIQEAYDRGFKEGIEEGISKRSTECNETIEAFEKLISETAQIREAFLRENLSNMFAICEKVNEIIVGCEMVDPDMTIKTIEKAIAVISQEASITVRVNSDVIDFVKSKHPEIMDRFNGIKNLTILADNEISPGGAVVQNESSLVDLNLSTQLQNLYKALRTKPGVEEQKLPNPA